VSGDAAAARKGASLLGPAIFAVAGFAVLIALGTWQLERKAWKDGLVATLDERVSAVPVAIPAATDWPALTRENSEFRRVRFTAEPLGRPPAYVYTGGSALRPDIKAPGYFVFAPVRIPTGEVVVVNAGYVADREHPVSGGKTEIVGYLRWPERPSWFIAAHDSSGTTWFVRDHRAMAKVKNWGEGVAPFYIDQESPMPPGGLPRPGPLTVKLRNDHLGYAITWFGLAAALAIIFVVWAGARRRERRAG
jgi:cytochrome oxidase assembly protein ShyY1